MESTTAASRRIDSSRFRPIIGSMTFSSNDPAAPLVGVAKKSAEKSSIGGRKYAARRLSPDGVAEAEGARERVRVEHALSLRERLEGLLHGHQDRCLDLRQGAGVRGRLQIQLQ